MEYVINAVHSTPDGLQIPHIADVELDFVRHIRHLRLILVAHIILLLLITREDTDFPDISFQKAVQNRVAERTGTASNH